MAAQKLEPERIGSLLSSSVRGDVLCSKWERAMYATDASAYQILPLCVVLPKSKEDVIAAVRFADENSIPVTARGGGSGLVGAALGEGIVIEFTRYMSKILTIGRDYVVCEPGVYKKNLDAALTSHGVFMPADPSSSAYCTIGGMIGTNASGAHSLKYGHTIEYLEEADVVLHDGTLLNLGPVDLDSPEWKEIRRSGSSDERSRIYNSLYDLLFPKIGFVRGSMPRVSKNSAGYRLDMIFDEQERSIFNPAKVLCASEGTFAIVVAAKFRTIPKPRKRGFLILRYDSLAAMGKAIPSITKRMPSAAELMDKRVIDAASVLNPDVKNLNKGKQIALIVEFDGDDPEEISEQLRTLQQEISKDNPNESEVITEEAKIDRIWSLRELSLGFAYKTREGGRRTECLIEDTVVPPDQLGEFLQELENEYKRFGLDAMSWGHVSEGNIHTRPFLDFKSSKDLETGKELADRIYTLVSKYKGSSTGEHSDGILRAPYIETIYGKQMVELFREVKRIFDPNDLLNPGKKTDSQSISPLRNLRYGGNYGRKTNLLSPAKPPSEISPRYALNWGAKNNKVSRAITGRENEFMFEDEVEACFGCGRCREQSNTSRMCPVYDADKTEVGACRGRNNLLRWMNELEGIANSFSLTKEYGRAIYENCIQCKMCTVDCPANTNVGKLMAEARARYVAAQGLPRGYQFFFHIDRYALGGCRLAPVSNALMNNSIVRRLLEFSVGIDRRKNFPPFHRKKFIDKFHTSHGFNSTSPEEAKRNSPAGGSIVFFYDTYLNYNEPDLGMRIVNLFEANEVQVIVPKQKSSGLPAIIEGDPKTGRETAKFNVGNLYPYAAQGIPIVTFSPSAGLTLKSDYLDVLDTPESRAVSEETRDIHEQLWIMNKRGKLQREKMQPIDLECQVHLHCHSIVQQVSNQVSEVLSFIPSLRFGILNDGCCGNGGSYSFIKGNFLRSLKMGRALSDDIQNSKIPVFSTGESCKVQLEQASGRKVGLTSELLAQTFSV